MESNDSNFSSVYFGENRKDKCMRMQEKIRKNSEREQSILGLFSTLEDESGLMDLDEYNADCSKRRKKHMSTKSYDFKGASDKQFREDMEEINSEHRAEKSTAKRMNEFERNDSVILYMNNKKYNGTIFQVNFKGIVVKTHDRKKIKLSWENIDKSNIHIEKYSDVHTDEENSDHDD
ncbi:hypothetical protein ENBRE01_0634 [Enteropsectra breve]|nr:hypothetical protein ENBRE01_0634 [Enteropsectra breve]